MHRVDRRLLNINPRTLDQHRFLFSLYLLHLRRFASHYSHCHIQTSQQGSGSKEIVDDLHATGKRIMRCLPLYTVAKHSMASFVTLDYQWERGIWCKYRLPQCFPPNNCSCALEADIGRAG